MVDRHSSPDRAVRVGGLDSVFGQDTALLNHGVYVICRLGGPYSESKASLRLRLSCMMKYMHQYKQKR